jgi:hypothetical protein
MSHLPVVAGTSNQWLREAFEFISQKHAEQAKTSPATAMALQLTERRIDQLTYVPYVDTSEAVESLIEAAKRHGAESDPDHEVGDLQDFLRAIWKQLTPAQRAAALRSGPVSAPAPAS